MSKILLIALSGWLMMAQTQIDLRTQSKQIDFTAASSTKSVKTGTAPPATCAVGELFFKTDAAAGANLYACASPDTWSVQGGGQGAAGLQIESAGTIVGSRGIANFLTGPGLMSVIGDTGTQINIQTGLDTAAVETQAGEQAGLAVFCGSASGSGRTYQCLLNPTLTSYTKGMALRWLPDVNGSGGPSTLDVDTLGPAPLKLADGQSDPSGTDIVGGRQYEIWYDGQNFRLPANPSGGAAGLTAIQIRAFGYSFDGGGSSLSAGRTGYVTVPFACAISAWSLIEDAGSATVDVWKTAVGGGLPTSVQSITGTAPPSIAGGNTARGTSLSGWNTTVNANDVLGFNLKAVSGASYVNLIVECDQ